MFAQREAWGAYLSCARALRRFLGVCDAEGVDVVVVKGAVTAFLLYDDPADRPLRDVDVRVRPADCPRLVAAAMRAGFTPVLTGQPHQVYGTSVLSWGNISIDIETHVGPPHFTRLDVDALLAGAHRVMHPQGFVVPVPETMHHALVLAINVFKDKFHKATPWSLDDAVRIARCPDFDVPRLVALGERYAATTLLWLVADHLAGLGHGRWQEVREALGRPPRPIYRKLHAYLSRARPEGLPLRLLTRVVADDPKLWPRAILRTGLWELLQLRRR